MTRLTLIAFAAAMPPLAGAVMAEDLQDTPVVPSGYTLYLHEMIFETRQDASKVVRFRYVMPIIGQEAVTFAHVQQDFEHLCNADAIPALSKQSQIVDQIIISLSDRETEFGATTSVATQFFEAYSVENGSCIWEGF